MRKIASLALAFALMGSTALAAPTLRADVTVSGDLVTVGDMFDDAGDLAATPLFRAPKPGTAGTVPVAAVRQAADRAGLFGYDVASLEQVRVARSGTVVDTGLFATLLSAELANRGVTGGAIEVDLHFDRPDLSFNATATNVPAQLIDLRYAPTGAFAAKFSIAGLDDPVDVTGSAELTAEVPHLTQTLAAGAVIGPQDVELDKEPLKFLGAASPATLDDVIGKALVRNSRAGLMLKAADVTEPLVVLRNASVTVTLHSGAMTLTVTGQALAGAAMGEPVNVMNTVTHKILRGTAIGQGAVEVTTGAPTTTIAGL